VALFALFALSGCDGGGTAAPAPSATAKPVVTSFASLGEAPIPFASVLAYSRGGAALHLLASTHTIGCDDLSGAYLREAGELTVELTLAPLANEDRWAVTRLRFGKDTRQGDLGRVTPTAVDPKKPVRVDLAPAGPWGQLHLGGKVEATPCGVLSVVQTPPREQPDLRFSLDGRSVAIRAASYETESRKLRLSTEPHDCRGGLAHSDVALTLILGDGAVDHAKLEGYRLVRSAGAKATSLAATIDEGEGTSIELSGKAEVGGYQLEVGGTLEATRCGE
jgi:hypothetical protein